MDRRDVQAKLRQKLPQPQIHGYILQDLMATSPEVAALFRQTNFTRQKKMLQMSLNLLISHAIGNDLVDGYLHQLADKHSRASSTSNRSTTSPG